MTKKTDWTKIDKLSTTLFAFRPSGDDEMDKNAIVANFAALQRVLRSNDIDVHHATVRARPNFDGPPIASEPTDIGYNALKRQIAKAVEEAVKPKNEELADLMIENEKLKAEIEKLKVDDVLVLVNRLVEIDRGLRGSVDAAAMQDLKDQVIDLKAALNSAERDLDVQRTVRDAMVEDLNTKIEDTNVVLNERTIALEAAEAKLARFREMLA